MLYLFNSLAKLSSLDLLLPFPILFDNGILLKTSSLSAFFSSPY